MTGFSQHVKVSAVAADLLDVSTSAGSLDTAFGMTTVDLSGGPLLLTVRNWRGDPPRVGDVFNLTLEWVRDRTPQ